MQTFSLSIERGPGCRTIIQADTTRFGPMTDKERRDTAMLLAHRDDSIKSVAIMRKNKIVDVFQYGEWDSEAGW